MTQNSKEKNAGIIAANEKTHWSRAIVIWLLLMAAEFIHGTIRTLWLSPAIGDFRARQIGVFTGSILMLTIVFFCINWIGSEKKRELVALGILWLILTLLFEIGLGHFVFGYSWEKIWEDYDILKGGLLPFGLLLLALSPLFAAKFRRIGKKIEEQKSRNIDAIL
jgi:hypothetical protein